MALPSLPKAGDTVIARDAYTRDLARYVAWVEVQAKLLTAIIASVLPADLLALREPLYGDLLLGIPIVLAHVAQEHGRVTAEDIAALRATLYEKLALSAGFLTHAALFAEKSARINLEEVIAPTTLFTIFKGTFAHHPSFLPTLGRFCFYEATPDRLKHTVPNLVTFLTPALPFITKLSNPSPSAFGPFGLVPAVPTDPAVVPPSPSKRALKKAGRKKKQGPKLGQNDALLAYLAQQGITVPPHLMVGALTLPPVFPQSSSSTITIPRTSMIAPTRTTCTASSMAGH